MLEGLDKPFTQFLLLALVPSCGFFELLGGFFAYLYRFYSSCMRRLACASTCLDSTVRLGLASISLILWQISTSQTSASPGSAGPSKLATKSLAKRARSISDEANASLLTVSSCTVVIFLPLQQLYYKSYTGQASEQAGLGDRLRSEVLRSISHMRQFSQCGRLANRYYALHLLVRAAFYPEIKI